jgi:hypothetical protein
MQATNLFKEWLDSAFGARRIKDPHAQVLVYCLGDVAAERCVIPSMKDMRELLMEYEAAHGSIDALPKVWRSYRRYVGCDHERAEVV